jgi:hypothetical protein
LERLSQPRLIADEDAADSRQVQQNPRYAHSLVRQNASIYTRDCPKITLIIESWIVMPECTGIIVKFLGHVLALEVLLYVGQPGEGMSYKSTIGIRVTYNCVSAGLAATSFEPSVRPKAAKSTMPPSPTFSESSIAAGDSDDVGRLPEDALTSLCTSFRLLRGADGEIGGVR